MKDSIGIVTNDKRPYEPVPKPTERFFRLPEMPEVDKSTLNRLYKRRSKLAKAGDRVFEEVNDLLQKALAVIPLKGFEENDQRKIRFYIEISLKKNAFSYTLKHEVA